MLFYVFCLTIIIIVMASNKPTSNIIVEATPKRKRYTAGDGDIDLILICYPKHKGHIYQSDGLYWYDEKKFDSKEEIIKFLLKG